MKQSVPEEVHNWFGGHLLENMPANTIVVSRDYRVVVANRSFREVFGEATGRHCYEVYKKRDSHCEHCLAAKTFEDGKTRVHDESGIDRHGHIAHFVVHTVPVFDADGAITHVIEMSLDVTEARRTERQLSVLFEQVPCRVALLNRELQVVRANGLARGLLNSNGASDDTRQHCYRAYKDRNSPCGDCPALRSFADGLPHASKQRGIDKEGKPRSFFVSTAPVSFFGDEVEHVIEMSVDVTETDLLEQEVLREGEFRRNLTESALEALVAVDESGTVTIFNPAAERLFGYAAADVIGTGHVWKQLPASVQRLFDDGGDVLLLPDAVVTDGTGEEIPVRVSAVVLREDERIIGGAAFLQDLRALKRMEKEKLQNERLAAVGETVAQLAHGIKNVLAGLQGGMYALRTGTRNGKPERVERGWRALERNVERITEMVKGFLSLSRGHVPEVDLVLPANIAEDVYQLYHEGAARQGIDLSLDIAEEMAPATLDAEKIHTCLANLVSNAIDACLVADGETHAVVIRVHEKNDAVVYEVTDDGCGMDYQIKGKVFTTFFTTKGLGGTGLGLLVTRKIVQEHGGQISVDSDPGRGSTFRIELPRNRLPALPAATANDTPIERAHL